MDRRSFFKLVGTASGGAITGACGHDAREIIPLLVPEQQIVPGMEEWRPSVCRECSAGCGAIVRLMQAEREILVDGETVRQPIAAIKKVEGNPLDTVSGGRLCARGQAAVQGLYHPDRLRGPQKRNGERGEGRFDTIGWDAALEEAARLLQAALEAGPESVVYLSRAEAGTRAVTVQRFLKALGAGSPMTTGIGDFAAERKAAEWVFGIPELPLYELQDATYVLSLGADFLGGWVSPVLYSRRFGHMRQGRQGLRGRLVHAESRFSQTAWSADRWLPVLPGGELLLSLAIGHLLLAEHPNRVAAELPAGLRETFTSVDLDQAVVHTGLPLRKIQEVASELAEAVAPLVVAGASIVRTNSAAAVAAGNALNLLLGNVGKPGGVRLDAPDDLEELRTSRPNAPLDPERLAQARLVFLDGVNPAYTWPGGAQLLGKAGAIISFASMLDDSAAHAD
jgi:anaerobic selenocysteine-containing dehydrogenase